MPPIDRLEGFRPGGHSMYQRVMVASLQGATACAVWIYIMLAPQNGERITNDNQTVFFGEIGSIRHKTLGFGNPPM